MVAPVVRLDESYAKTLSPHGYWSMQFFLPDDAYLQWNSTVPRGANLAVYGRRNALPTHTQYDVHHLLRGFSRRARRTSGVSPTDDDVTVCLSHQRQWCLKNIVHV